MIDLRRLHVLRAVAHYGTVTAAARALHVTSSAASQQIRQLARELGVDLLEPQGRGLRLHAFPGRRAVAHYGTVTAAARALHVTPSAASQQIRQLARELGVDLLEPQGRGVRLTPAAESLLAHADAIQARWDRAELDLRAEQDAPSGVL